MKFTHTCLLILKFAYIACNPVNVTAIVTYKRAMKGRRKKTAVQSGHRPSWLVSERDFTYAFSVQHFSRAVFVILTALYL